MPAFADFLSAAALSDAELVNYANIARDCGVSAPAVKEYFQILVDTLLGRFVPAYTKRPKRRVIQAPKFYFADVGVVNILAKRGTIEPGSERPHHHALAAPLAAAIRIPGRSGFAVGRPRAGGLLPGPARADQGGVPGALRGCPHLHAGGSPSSFRPDFSARAGAALSERGLLGSFTVGAVRTGAVSEGRSSASNGAIHRSLV